MTKNRRSFAHVRIAALALVAAAAAPALAQERPLPPVTSPAENAVSEDKRVLGKVLFWEEQLSSDNTMACGTCHIPAAGGADPRRARGPGADGTLGTADDVFGSPGVVRADAAGDYVRDPVFGLAPQVTGRAAPPALGAMFSRRLFWDGRADATFTDPQSGRVSIVAGGALESQAVGPPLSAVEMAHAGRAWDDITAKLATAAPLALATNLPADVSAALDARDSYPELFRAAFGDPAITAERIAFAIATYERTLVPDQTPFDRFTRGETNALTANQRAGLTAFRGAARCDNCHETPLTTDDSFRNIGLRPVAEDRGRQGVTGDPADRGKFKVPGLRNVGLRRSFMHNGQLTTIEQVLRFYARAPGTVQFADNQDAEIARIRLPRQDQDRIADFLRNGLTDPRAAAERFPFDRPTLHSQLPRNPALVGGGRAGSAGVPVMIAITPPNAGNASFRLGVDRAPGGATAMVALSASPPAGGELAADELLGPVVLAADGHGTLHWPVPADATAGEEIYFQWRIEDPAAAGGIALSAVARATVIGGADGAPEPQPEPDPGPQPDPDPVGDGHLFARSAAFRIDWRRHARGASADTFAISGMLNPAGAADSAQGALLTLRVGDDVVAGPIALDARGRARGVRLSVATGAYAVRVRGLDLRDVVGVADATGTGVVTLPVTLEVRGISLATPVCRGDVEFSYRTRAGVATRGRYRFAAQGSPDGAFALQARAAEARSGDHVLRLRAALAAPGVDTLLPEGDVTITIGAAEPIVVPEDALVSRRRGFRLRAGTVEGLRRLAYDGRTRQMVLTTTALDDTGIPEAAAGAETRTPLAVRVEIETGTGLAVFQTVVELRRRSAATRLWRR